MTLEEKLKNIKTTSTLESLPQYDKVESAKDLEELWNKVISPTLPDKSTVVAWHNLLMDYVKQDNAVFSLRAYASGKNSRRGFLNKVYICGQVSFGTFYTDNSIPVYFYSLAKDGFIPTLTELNNALINKLTFPYGYFSTSAGTNFVAYPKGDNPEINKKGYKLAHIFSAGENYSNKAGYGSIKEFCDSAFPNSAITQWQNNILPSGQHFRPICLKDKSEAEKIRKFAIAHFIRSVHPINYFLIPNKTNRRDEASGIIKTNIYWRDPINGKNMDEIGEYSKLIEFVAAKIKNIYKDTKVYEEFLDLIYPTGNCINPTETNVTIDAEYAIGIWQKKIGGVGSISKSSASPKSHSTSTVPSSKKNKKDNSQYSFSVDPTGSSYGKGRLVLAIISQYVKEGKATNYTELLQAFPDKLQGSKGVVRLLNSVSDNDKGIGSSNKRYFVNDDEIILLTSGEQVVVCSQWGTENVDKFIEYANNFGYKIQKL